MDEYCEEDRDVILDMGEAAQDTKEPALHIPQQPQERHCKDERVHILHRRMGRDKCPNCGINLW